MIIDPSALESYREIMGDEADEFIADILETYLSDSINLLATLDEALSSGSVDKFVRAAHTLKSTSATVGAQQVSSLAANLEKRGQSENLSDLASDTVQIRKEYEQAAAQLKELFL
ncbi:MAG: hypothetical protein B5M51_01950 [Anaerolinea sp. 4484_236]|nr:MAG: hypothetical protein B5M51_01950 [Anaerolinea sp. 4484_236]OQY35111.1 MAG: hypothetical protein B6243_05015 [Anaerolineaceae bacterium 4572_5.2]